MGLFGSKKKTYYNSTSTPMYEVVPSLLKQTAVGAVVQNRNMASDLITNLANGVGYNANRLYTYASRENTSYPWGLPEGTFSHIAPQTPDYVRAAIQEEIGKPIQLVYSNIETDPSTSHFIYEASYYLLDSFGKVTGDPIAWSYDESTGVHPLLNVVADDTHDVSPYFPIIPIMQDQVYLAEEGKEDRLAIRQALKYLLLDPDDIHEAITADPDYGDNPVEDAFVMLAVQIDDDTQVGIEYLYRYFNFMHGISEVKKETYDTWLADRSTRWFTDDVTPPVNRVVLEEDNYKMEMGWLYSTSNVVNGNLVVTSADEDNGIAEVVAKSDYFESEFIAGGEVAVGSDSELTYSTDVLVLRKQINATQYIELVVHGLVHSNWAVGKELRTTLKDAFDPEEDSVAQSFNVPLRKDLLFSLGPVKTHDLMYTSTRMVLNDKFVQKLKWYQTGLFKVIMLIIIVVISVYFPPAGIAAGTIAALNYAIVNIIIMKLLVPVAIKALEDIIGEELALLVVVAVNLYMGDFSSAALASASITVASAISTIKFESAIKDINDELKSVQEDIDLLEEEASQRRMDVLNASKAVSGDTYAMMAPLHHVKIFHLENRKPLLIHETTHKFTDMSRFTDRPDSYIRLGHTGV